MSTCPQCKNEFAQTVNGMKVYCSDGCKRDCNLELNRLRDHLRETQIKIKAIQDSLEYEERMCHCAYLTLLKKADKLAVQLQKVRENRYKH